MMKFSVKQLIDLRLVLVLLIVLYSGGTVKGQQWVDSSTPVNALPMNAGVGADWVLDFSDEFNTSTLDLTKWTINVSSKSRNPRPNLGISDWWWKSQNVSLNDSNLVLSVTKHDHNTMYCGSVFSSGKYETKYGYFEARIKIADASKGTHTAFWLQGSGMGNVDGTANDGAEIDIFESAWLGDYTKSVVHIDGYGANHQASTKQYSTPGIHEGYHVWGFYWTETFMKIYYDGILKVTYSDPKWIVKVKEYLWLSDGASFGYEGDNFTKEPNGFLTNAYVDYVRVWKQTGDVVVDENIIKDGDFEDPSGAVWNRNNSDIKLHEPTFPVSDGSYYTRFPGIPSERSISQSISVVPGKTYVFQFTGRVQNSHAASDVNNHATNGPATLMGELLDGDNALLTISTQSSDYTTMEGEITIPSGVSQLIVRISKNWNVGYVDDVRLIEKTVTASKSIVPNFSVRVFPNPVKDQLHIQSIELLASCEIFDCSGRNIQRLQSINSYSIDLEFGEYTKGLYLIRITDYSGGVHLHKVVRK